MDFKEVPKVDYMHYRESTLGRALEDSLRDMVDRKLITDEQKSQALRQFDQCMNTRLRQLPEESSAWMGLDGEIVTYRNAENVWYWTLRNGIITFAPTEAQLKVANSIEVGNMQVIATDAFPGRIIARGKSKKKKLKTVAPATKKK